MQWLNSLDELLFEIVSWIIFFPITLWKVIRAPFVAMAYAEAELASDNDDQFSETLSPPIFLIFALVIAHAIGIAMGGGVNPVVRSHHGLASLVNDNTTLLLLRIVIFSVFPLMLAARYSRKRFGVLSRKTLKSPFYAQCFVAAPFALMVSAGLNLSQLHHVAWTLTGAALAVAAFLTYGVLQILWFARSLDQSMVRAFGNASAAMIESLVVAALISYFFIL